MTQRVKDQKYNYCASHFINLSHTMAYFINKEYEIQKSSSKLLRQ